VWPWAGPAQAQQESGSRSVSRPKNAEYVLLTKCAACHFDQYKDWKDSKHSKAFEILPVKYRNDASCLKCHTTGSVGDVSSYEYGVSCQACHGPGSEHANLALRFVNELITEEGLTSLRKKIQRLDMHQCVNCHISKAHKKHPPYDAEAAVLLPSPKKSANFFQSVHGERAESGERSGRTF
jgi:recombinational DNA repair protein (RecF pathway)